MSTSARVSAPWPTTHLRDFGDVFEVGMLAVDLDLVVRDWNRWLEVASGRSAIEVIGQPLLAIFPELEGSSAEAAFRGALAGGTVVLSQRFHRYLLPLPAVPGYEQFDRMQQSARIVPVMRTDGQPEGAVAFIQDVTERVAREEELRQAIQTAEEANRAKSEFLAAMSHDFRTPLSAILGYASLIDEGIVGPVTQEQRLHLSRIKTSAQHLSSMIEEVLAFVTFEAGKTTVHIENTNATTLAHEASEMLERQASAKGIRLDIDVPVEPVRLRTDPTKLRQILVNLVGNAVKFTDEGFVAVELRAEGERIVFRVQDTGPGILPEDAERIFEPFTRLPSAVAARKRGTGLGLTVSRRLARLLGGDLTVESQPGKGSTFTVWLPESGLER